MKKFILVYLTIIFSLCCASEMQKTKKEEAKIKYNTCGYIQVGYSTIYYFNKYKIEITSEPQGVKIELNNNLIGITPMTYLIDGEYAYNEYFIFKAYPIENGQYLQTKLIKLSTKLPRNIYFYMKLHPVPQEYKIDVDKK